MTRELVTQIETFLRNSAFEVTSASAPFNLVAQNTSLLVFVAEVKTDLDQTVRNATTLLASPFRSKQFGPKTMEMYCIFVCPEDTPISTIERWEQDLKFCRKVFVTNSLQIESRLCFLQPLDDSLTGFFDIDSMFWSRLATQLSHSEFELIKSLGTNVKTADELLKLLGEKR